MVAGLERRPDATACVRGVFRRFAGLVQDVGGFLFYGAPGLFVRIPCDVDLVDALGDFARFLQALQFLEVVLEFVDAAEPGLLLVFGVLAHRLHVFGRRLLVLRLAQRHGPSFVGCDIGSVCLAGSFLRLLAAVRVGVVSDCRHGRGEEPERLVGRDVDPRISLVAADRHLSALNCPGERIRVDDLLHVSLACLT